MFDAEYLGDAVYVRFNNRGQIELILNDHRHEPIIYLEPEVFTALKAFGDRKLKEANEWRREAAGADRDAYLDGDYAQTGSKRNTEWGK